MYRTPYQTNTNQRTTTVVSNNDRNDTIYYIATENVEQVKKLVNITNVNNIIDNKNGYTAFHHAIKSRNTELINYMLSIEADPSIRTTSGEDAFDLSLKFHNRNVIDNVLYSKNKTIDNLKKEVSVLDEKNRVAENRISYLQSFTQESENSKRKIDVLTTENTKLKADYQTLNEKYVKLDASYEGLLKRSRK